jgi:glutamyl-tRNA synthetase
MHIGNLRTGLYAYLFARKNNGKFVLRIEDTDTERYVEGAVDIILRTLADAGMSYDEGPGKGGINPPYVQSERKGIYAAYARELVERGAAYYCFCTRERLAKMHEEGGDGAKYDKHCLSLPKAEVAARLKSGEPYVIRQNIPVSGVIKYTDLVFGEIAVDCKDLEDNILLKSDGMPTYNFAHVVDDRLMGITHVIRGMEYLSSTPKYNLIYKGFGWDAPQYMHLPPIMRDATHKLSKRTGDASYEDFKNRGYLAAAILNYIALLGWSPKDDREKFTLAELEQRFNTEGLNKSPAIFDEGKMRWLNAQYVRELPYDAYKALALPWLKKAGADGYDADTWCRLLQGRTEVFEDIPRLTAFIKEFDGYDTGLFDAPKQKTDRAVAKALLPAIIDAVEGCAPFTGEALYAALQAVAEAAAVKTGAVMWTARIALTGTLVTPGGATDMAELLGKKESVRRLAASLARL